MPHHSGISPLKGIDRLFEVPDNKQCPWRAVTRRRLEEFIAKPPQKTPLCRTGILSLVEKHVADAIIQLPCDPLRGITIGQHRTGSPNKIVIVQKAALCFQPLIFRFEGTANPVQSCRQLPTALRRARR